ncbi:MAG: winged helix-turn-helix domain-containing protein [Bryobacteraceae bacterium]|nr:winged helix-turn-helix domain-containing protein [Bryobacteraceae bacterium]
MTEARSRRLRFGVFDFDPASGELRREGIAVKLQAQPAQVLGILLENAGAVVSREALRQAVWGGGTHVDFDSGLNFCIAQVRSALGDSAESPVFVKTVPKRGYQFIAPVSAAEEAVLPPAGPSVRSRRALLLTAGASLAGFGGLYAWLRTRLGSSQPVRIAVARFENQSGDPALDSFTDGLGDAVVAELTNSLKERFEVIGNAPLLRGARITQNVERIGIELKAQFVILGQVMSSGASGRVLIHLIRMPDQAHLTVTRVDNPDFADGVRTQGEIARRAAADFASKLAPLDASGSPQSR